MRRPYPPTAVRDPASAVALGEVNMVLASDFSLFFGVFFQLDLLAMISSYDFSLFVICSRCFLGPILGFDSLQGSGKRFVALVPLGDVLRRWGALMV